MPNSDLKYLIALNQDIEIGARTCAKLLAIFDSAEELWKTDPIKLKKKNLPGKLLEKIIALRQKVDPDEELKKAQKLNIRVISLNDPQYPRLLKEIADPPILLYVRGELLAQDDLAVAVVGAREYTYYGRQVLEKLVPPLIQTEMTIVSGLALGIDGYAHREALKNPRGRTIAVLPTGVDRIYPACHRALAEAIIQGRGAVISEFPLGTQSYPNNFPIRNRIIAGLSLGTLVIEASIKSGSFLTAKSALEYNREVFAVPGSIFSNKSEGTNNLIKLGAKMVTTIEDILAELNLPLRQREINCQTMIPDNEEESILLALLPVEQTIHIDKLVLQSGLDIALVNSTLTMMEMKGKVRNVGGNLYIKR